MPKHWATLFDNTRAHADKRIFCELNFLKVFEGRPIIAASSRCCYQFFAPERWCHQSKRQLEWLLRKEPKSAESDSSLHSRCQMSNQLPNYQFLPPNLKLRHTTPCVMDCYSSSADTFRRVESEAYSSYQGASAERSCFAALDSTSASLLQEKSKGRINLRSVAKDAWSVKR
jgi:hypothetical protein